MDPYIEHRNIWGDFHQNVAAEIQAQEMDLLRSGARPPLARPVPPAPYYITLSRAERRPRVEVWPLQLQEPLPILPIPLRAPDPDTILDLGAALAAVYERGAYARVIDYHLPPLPPALSESEQHGLDT
jgi:anti-sigma factor RsiW